MRKRHGRVVWCARVRRQGRAFGAEFPTAEAAIAWRAQVLGALAGHGSLPAAPPRPEAPAQTGRRTPPTVEDACRSLAYAMRHGTVRTKQGRPYRPSVVRSYEENLRTLIVPALGGYPLATLTVGDVQRAVDMIAADRSPEHARKALVALRVVIRLAIRDGVVPASVDPCRGVRQPRSDGVERDVRVLTPAEADALLAAAEGDDARLGRSLAAPLIALLLGCGLRTGEALALTWGDGLDLDLARVRIFQTLDRDRDSAGRLTIVPGAKSSAGVREIPLPPSLSVRLKRHFMATSRPAPGSLVFSDALGTPIYAKGALAHLWRRVVGAAALAPPAPTLHHLRHTWAVWSLRSGVAPEVVRALGGWSSTAMVHARYGRHAFAHELAGFATQLDAWRDGQASTPG
jgi:integrase